jgi:hypothetical protein
MHEGLTQIHYKSFFHLTRLESLYFDIAEKRGLVFMLSGSLQSGVIGVMAIDSNEEYCYGQLMKA